ncbi:MAG: hypothetical protein IID59_09895, partial [Proteobacteria bacterium]|nr:hypothetical protein [Pseudomonadota bacterium]
MRAVFCGIFASILMVGSAVAASPGAIIANQASLEYQDLAGQPAFVVSNQVFVIAAALPSTSSIEFTRVLPAGSGTYQETVGPSACLQGGLYVNLANPTLIGGSVIDPTLVQEADVASVYNLGEPLFVRLDDSDQNLDFQLLDTVDVSIIHDASGDTEIIRLTETGLDTGIFAGYIPSARATANPGDCILQGAMNSDVRVTYTDPSDPTDSAQDVARVDPLNRVFESVTGVSVSGTQIELVFSATGLPAVVYGNDGVSQFPSSITSGGSATDSSGTSYVFGPGEFRFPVVPDGDYRLVVLPPPAFSAPSSADPNDLQNLPGAPYSLGSASFGTAFTKSGEISIGFDIPVDPA